MQRQIAIVAKRNHVDIKQLAANLRFKNKIKQSGLDDRKIEKFLDGLESYKKKLDEEKTRLGDYYNDFEMFRRLVRDGLTSEVIFRAVHVLENDFTKSDIDQIIEDMRTYGNVAAARRKLQRQYETVAESDSSLT